MKKILIGLFYFFVALALALSSTAGVGGKRETKETFGTAKNVIFMIGDGMGFNSIRKTKYEKGIDELAFDRFALAGESMTASASSIVTDSAAGGTALACGVRIKNHEVGVYRGDKNAKKHYPKSLSELAKEQGKLAGVVTTDQTTGATPASFSVHSNHRTNEKDIYAKQISSNLDLIWGTKTDSFTPDDLTSTEYSYISDKASMDALDEGSKSYGRFTDELWHEKRTNEMPTLAEMTTKAIDLLDDDEDGFFLMVEGAHIDKNNHANLGDEMEDAMLSFSDALDVALKYAKAHEGTLVVVTADHETGGITFIDGEFVYTRGNHSGLNVPLYVYGCDGFMFDGETMKNSEVSRRVAYAMGREEWPIEVKVSK